MVDDCIDVILVDQRKLGMPGLSGDELLRELRERGYNCPVSMPPAVDSSEDILKRHVDDDFVKPLDQAELREAVPTIIAQAWYVGELRAYLVPLTKKAAIALNLCEQELASSGASQTLPVEGHSAKNEADATIPEMKATDQEQFAGFGVG